MRFFFLIALLLSILYANHVSWQSNFDKAHIQALKENKKLMVLLVKKSCKSCKDTIKTTFMNQKYIDEINSKFVSVLVTKDQKNNYPIEMLYTLTYPSLFFLDNRELFVCEPIRGEVTPERVKNHLKQCD